MTHFGAAFWVEALTARRSRVAIGTALGFSLALLMGGPFMFILKDPARARSMGIVSAKAQLVAGVADWPTYFSLLAQATAVGGLLVFGIATAWMFGREFADRTTKQLLALPTPRATIVGAKFVVLLLWFPWSVPALHAGLAGPHASRLGIHSYTLVAGTLITGLAATSIWWERADQDR